MTKKQAATVLWEGPGLASGWPMATKLRLPLPWVQFGDAPEHYAGAAPKRVRCRFWLALCSLGRDPWSRQKRRGVLGLAKIAPPPVGKVIFIDFAGQGFASHRGSRLTITEKAI